MRVLGFFTFNAGSGGMIGTRAAWCVIGDVGAGAPVRPSMAWMGINGSSRRLHELDRTWSR